MENPFPPQQALHHQNSRTGLRSVATGFQSRRGSSIEYSHGQSMASPFDGPHPDFLLHHQQHQHQHQQQQQQQQQQLSPSHQIAMPHPAAAGTLDANGNGLMQGRMIENGAARHTVSAAAGATGTSAAGHNNLEFSRSPPSARNTSHVPCKFFRNGTCQAGNACPFSHTLETQVEVPCKYFAKGNCKFGPKCALAHILYDGRRVNRPQFDMGADVRYNMGAGRQSVSQLPDSISYPGGIQPTSTRPASFGQAAAPAVPDDYFFQQQAPNPQHKQFSYVNAMDSIYTSPPASNYGSPTGESGRLTHLSPSIRAIDAPLPASFDSQGISHFARFGPSAASVPSRFGFNPLTQTSPTTSTATSTAFSNLNSLARNEPSMGNRSNVLACPPPATGVEAFPRRILHSETQSTAQMISSSLPAPFNNLVDEDYDEAVLPHSIRDLWAKPTPPGRRSMDADDVEPLSSLRQSTSGFVSPADSKVGSPSNASPNPSRFGQFFAQRQHRDEPHNNAAQNELGHVGSPLRKSNLNPDSTGNLPTSGSIRASLSRPRSRDVSPFGLSSPQMRAAAGPSMLSQQFGSLRLASDGESNLRPALIRNAASNSGAGGIPAGALTSEALSNEQRERARLYRVVSNSSIGRNDTIEEEPEICLFSMEEEEAALERERARKAGDGSSVPGSGTTGPGSSAGGGGGGGGGGSDSGRPSVDSQRGGDMRKEAWNITAAPSGSTSVSANDSSAKSSPGSSGGGGGGGLGYGVIGGGRLSSSTATATPSALGIAKVGGNNKNNYNISSNDNRTVVPSSGGSMGTANNKAVDVAAVSDDGISSNGNDHPRHHLRQQQQQQQQQQQRPPHFSGTSLGRGVSEAIAGGARGATVISVDSSTSGGTATAKTGSSGTGMTLTSST